ncbi:hypothetical protein [Evansella halocellulosilytica]|uniref:hypothetical protein n=1 Tax=Evansella halocellulosilytica TaxID=2011013 RepID=UPI0015CE0904|nr:hypothetical protein [Evansella halocellulosilytica]
MNDKRNYDDGVTMTTADLYFLEKEIISLNSVYRPQKFNNITYSFRQTKFPYECKS